MLRDFKKYIIAAVALILIGWLGSFLMVLDILESTFLANFIFYILAAVGFFIGFWCVINIIRSGKRKNQFKSEQNKYKDE